MADDHDPGRRLAGEIAATGLAVDPRPATVGQIAEVYAAMAVSMDLMLALAAMVSRMGPGVTMSPEWTRADELVGDLSLRIAKGVYSLGEAAGGEQQ